MKSLRGVALAILAGSILALIARPLKAVAPERQKGTLHVLTIGVSNYPNHRSRLAFAAKDAVDVATVWRAQQGKLFEKVQCETLTDEKATAREIVKALDGLHARVGPRDMVIVRGNAPGQTGRTPRAGPAGAGHLPCGRCRQAELCLPRAGGT